LGLPDILVLPLFGTAAEQQDQRITILSEVDAVARTPIDPVFAHAATDTLRTRKVALPHPFDGAWIQ
jgi:hypothetical protein